MRLLRSELIIMVAVLLLASGIALAQGLADSPWPKAQGPGTRNTGRSPYAGPATPTVKWVFDLGGETHFRSPSIGPDGTIYVASSSVLYAVRQDGTVKWLTQSPTPYLSHVTISSDGFLYVQTGLDKMLKVEADTGVLAAENWPITVPAQGIYPATISASGLILFGNGGGGTRALHAFRADGTELWRIQVGDNVETLPAIDETTGTVYAGNNDHQIIKADSTTGQYFLKNIGVWGYVLSHVALGDDGTVYCSSYGDNNLFAFDAFLNEKWRTRLGTWWVIPPSIGYDGTIYTAGRNTNKLTALSPLNGFEKWSISLDGDFNAPPVIDINGTVYVVTSNTIYAVMPGETSAQIKWTYELSGQGYPQPAIGKDGTLYILTKNGKLTALGKQNTKPQAKCKNIEVLADSNCQAFIQPADIDDGSSDPDGDPIELSIDDRGPLSLGTHIVHLTVTDKDGLSDTCAATVTVIDATPPVPDLPELPIIRGQCFAEITTIPTATDNCRAKIQATTTDPLMYSTQGTYMVRWKYDDGHSAPIIQTQTVIVRDTTPPVISMITASPNSLWPPNHQMVPVVLDVKAADNCGETVNAEIIVVVSNEPVNGLGDGDTYPDWQITGKTTLNLRSERSGTGNGRIYTISVVVRDSAGNQTTKDVTVIVPKNKGK